MGKQVKKKTQKTGDEFIVLDAQSIWQKEPMVFNSLFAGDTMDAITVNLGYLSEYVMNHYPEDALLSANGFVQRLEKARQDTQVLIGQFKKRAAGKDPRGGKS